MIDGPFLGMYESHDTNLRRQGASVLSVSNQQRVRMSSSIELINPKAESVRRAAALQVSGVTAYLLAFADLMVHCEYAR